MKASPLNNVRGVLLIGFNRPNFFGDRLKEIEKISDPTIKFFISIDGPRSGNQRDIDAQRQIIEKFTQSSLSRKATVWISEENSGCDIHIYRSITQAFQFCDSLVVVEDDIEMTSQLILEMFEVACVIPRHLNSSPIIAMSGRFWRNWTKRNRWRLSNFFCAWGYLIPKEFWDLHRNRTEGNEVRSDFIFLESNPKWKKMSQRKRSIWQERMSRHNYDYAIQKTLFTHGIQTIAPKTRMINNFGHGVSGASHTRFATPWYLRKKVKYQGPNSKESHSPVLKARRLSNWFDSQTWVGDGIFSVRGRTIGFRTAVRIVNNRMKSKNQIMEK